MIIDTNLHSDPLQFNMQELHMAIRALIPAIIHQVTT